VPAAAQIVPSRARTIDRTVIMPDRITRHVLFLSSMMPSRSPNQ
jgi:hypothetical protein